MLSILDNDDIASQIFNCVYTRAHTCSVSSVWYAAMLRISKGFSSAPELYDCGKIHITADTSKRIFMDYHLFVRINSHKMLFYIREMCLVATAHNLHIYELFVRLGLDPGIYALLIRGLPIPAIPDTSPTYASLIIFMIKNDYADVIVDKKLPYPKSIGDQQLRKIVMITHDPDLINWLCEHDRYAPHYMIHEMIKRDIVDILPVVYKLLPGRCVEHVYKEGSVTMVKRLLEITNTGLDEAITFTYDCDNLPVFDYLVELGVDTSGCDYFDGLSNGNTLCPQRVKPAIVDTHALMTLVAESNCIPLEYIVKEHLISQEEFNYGLECALREDCMPERFIPYANNYDVIIYKKIWDYCVGMMGLDVKICLYNFIFFFPIISVNVRSHMIAKPTLVLFAKYINTFYYSFSCGRVADHRMNNTWRISGRSKLTKFSQHGRA